MSAGTGPQRAVADDAVADDAVADDVVADDAVADDVVTDCSAVLADVWTFLDHECDDASRARLQRHLDECGPCLTALGIEEQIKSLLSRKCGGERAPSALRVRLTASIRTTVIEQAGAAPTESG